MKIGHGTWITAIALLIISILLTSPKMTGMAVSENQYDTLIQQSAAQYDTSFALIKAVIKQESSFNPDAVSPTGCKGLMQFCAPTAIQYNLCDKKGCQIRDDRPVPEKIIDAGAKYLSYLTNKFKAYSAGYQFAIASYNAGEGVINTAIKATGKDDPTWEEVSAALKPEYITYFSSQKQKEDKITEIRNYVSKVMNYYQQYGGQINLVQDSIGTYTVRPSFETTINYDFSDYDKIKNGIKMLEDNCITKGAQDINQCITDNINTISSATGLSWSLGSCDKGEKAIFYSFIKAYKECFFSLDDDCYCQSDVYTDSSLNGDYKITLEDAGVYIISMGKYSQELEGHRKYIDNTGIEFTPTEKQADIELGYINGAITKNKFENFVAPKNEKFTFYKNKGELYLAVTQNQDIPIITLQQRQKCSTKQESFQFCATNNNKKFPKIDDKGKFSTEPITYKFAAIFKDTVPPPKITDLIITDKQTAERSLNLTWNKSTAKDTKYYKIYLSEQTFTNVTKALNILNVTAKPDLTAEQQAFLRQLSGSETSSNTIQNESTIHTYINVSEDDKQYYIAVTAVDNDGNEFQQADPKIGISIDDLGPMGPVIGYDATNKKLNITIPSKNQDGTNITENEIKIEIRKLPGENCDTTNINQILSVQKNDIAKGKPNETIKDITFNNLQGCYAFTAEDQHGNIKTDELKKLQKPEDFIIKLQLP